MQRKGELRMQTCCAAVSGYIMKRTFGGAENFLSSRKRHVDNTFRSGQEVIFSFGQILP